MFTHQWLPELQLEQINNETGRVYQTPEGNVYPSITSVLSKNKSKELLEWQAAVGEEQAKEISSRAARRGTGIHLLAEQYLKNEVPEYKNFIQKDSFLRFKKVLDNVSNVRLLESRLYTDVYELAGTVDCVADYNNELSIVDFKTSNSRKYESMIDNYFIQTYAYKIMFEERYNIEIKNLVILISVDHDVPQIFTSKDFSKWSTKLREVLSQG